MGRKSIQLDCRSDAVGDLSVGDDSKKTSDLPVGGTPVLRHIDKPSDLVEGPKPRCVDSSGRSSGVIVVDNAVPEYAALRMRALAQTFGEVEVHGDDGVYPNSCLVDIPELADAVRRTIVKPIHPIATGFRFSTQDEKHWIHEDSAIGGTYAAVLYLPPPNCPKSGTAFWKHHGADRVADAQCTEAWGQTDFVEMRPNRLVIYPVGLHHSRWPLEGFGDSPSTGRLIAMGVFGERPPISIRDARQEDLEALLRGARAFYDEFQASLSPGFSFKHVAVTISQMLDSRKEIALVATIGGEIVGSAGAAILPVMHSGKQVCQERWWWVSPEHRRGGVGGELLSALERRGAELGTSSMTMFDLSGKLGKFFKSAGYRPTEQVYMKWPG